MICSSSLLHMEVMETGRKLDGVLLSPFLWIGEMLATLRSDGTIPVSNDCWKMDARIGAKMSASSFRIRAGIPSGPVAFLIFSDCRSLRTPPGSTIMWSADGNVEVPMLGMLLVFSVVKTEQNCLLKHDAFPLLSKTTF